jgi:MbtH protein
VSDDAEIIEGDAVYDVVVNGEGQYSIWPDGRPMPNGWEAVGKRGSKRKCLDHIEEVWTDLRPRSLREHEDSELLSGSGP